MIPSTYLDAFYNSGGVPGLPGTIDDEIDPENWVFKEYKSNEGSLWVAMARHAPRICVYRATVSKKLLNTFRGFRDNVKN